MHRGRRGEAQRAPHHPRGPITVPSDGEAAAVVRPDALRVHRAAEALTAAADLQEALRQGRSSRLDDRLGLDERRAEELAAHVRESRTNR